MNFLQSKRISKPVSFFSLTSMTSFVATTLLMAFTAIAALAPSPAMADQSMATTKNCMACHAVDRKLVGPSFHDVAQKYAGKPDAVSVLTKKIKAGGSGVWGPVPMPSNDQVTEAEARQLATWLLATK